MFREKALSLFFVLFSTCFSLLGQKLAHNWNFGDKVGLTFNTEPPSFFPSVLVSNEGSASISDSLGRLMLYSNGGSVWNWKNLLIPNGNAPNGNTSATQQMLLQWPGKSNRFILIHHNQGIFQAGRRALFSVIRKDSLQGTESFLALNTTLINDADEKIAAVHHRNGRDIWLCLRKSNSYFIYKIDTAGLQTTPQEFAIGNTGGSYPYIGQMKFSADGKRLANTSASQNNPIEVLDFNDSTGVLSNPRRIQVPLRSTHGSYGCEFSCNGNLLYVQFHRGNAQNNNGFVLKQFDLRLGQVDSIAKYSRTIDSSEVLGGGSLQLGPDGKIYVPLRAGNIGAINSPNQIGLACGFVRDQLVLPAGTANTYGLPGICASYLKSRPTAKISGTCEGRLRSFSVENIQSYNSIRWNFDDPASGLSNIGTGLTLSHTFSGPGIYRPWVIVETCFGNDTLWFDVLIGNPRLTRSLDTSACIGTSVTIPMRFTNGMAGYQLNGQSVNLPIQLSVEGTYILQVEAGGCSTSDTLFFTQFARPDFELGPDIRRCDNLFPIAFNRNFPAADARWNDGTTSAGRLFLQPGVYTLTLNRGACQFKDSIRIVSLPVPFFSLGPDLEVCFPERALLGNAAVSGISYNWNTGSTASQIQVGQSGSFILTQTNTVGCSWSDTLSVNVRPLPLAFSLGADTTLCFPNTLRLVAPVGYDEIKWDNGSSDTTRTLSDPGVYWLTVRTNGCSRTDSLKLGFRYAPALPNLLKDSVFCLGDSLILQVPSGDWSVQWNGAVGGLSYVVAADQELRLQVQNVCGWVEQTATYRTEDCELFIPNLVTQEGQDGNNFFRVPNLWRYPHTLEIVNRWGQSVFQSTDYEDTWPSSPLKESMYFFKLQVSHPKRGGNFSGWIWVHP